MVRKLIYLLLFGFMAYPLFSQEYSYRHYTVKDGLVQNQVLSVFQDSKGYIWLGTKGGVSRFDGKEFYNYTINDGLMSNIIKDIFEDEKGRIYFCSKAGISRLENGKIKVVLRADTISPFNYSLIITKFTETEFLITTNSLMPVLIEKYDSAIIKRFYDLSKMGIKNIVKIKDSEYFVSCKHGKIFHITENSVTVVKEGSQALLKKGKAGNIYSYNNHKIYKYNPKDNTFHLVCHYKDRIIDLFDIDKKGRLYLAENKKKLILLDDSVGVYFKKKFNYINRILIDRNDNLWIATETGFYRKINDAFENFTPECKANEYIWSIVEDKKNNIWFASYGDGLTVFDGKQIKRVTNYKNVYSLFNGRYFYTGAIKASNNSLYFPVKEDGVLKYDNTGFSILKGFPKGSVLDAYEDTINGRFLFASTRGLVIVDQNKKPVVIKEDFDKNINFIKTIAQDKYGRYWLGGEYTLTIYDGKNFIKFPNEQFNYNHGAVSIFMDDRKNMWLGTTSGLYFFDYKRFSKIGQDILTSQVSSFTERGDSKLIMGVNYGLAILDLKRFYNDSTVNIEILDESKGFLGFDCIRNGILKDYENNIYVAASDRVVKFYPEKLKKDTTKPKVVIQQIFVSAPENEIVDTIYDYKIPDTAITLEYFQKNLRIDFHAIHFYAPEKIIYKYRLEGYDKNWSRTTSERYASYTNLPPGKYSFKVMARNVDGIWGDLAEASFEIIPAFWQTLSFKIFINILIILLFLTAGYLILNYRRKRREQQQKTENQLWELQLKTIRSQMDPHFTFNALNSISSAIYNEDKEMAYRYFVQFSKLLRTSLEFSDKISRSLESEIDFTRNYLDIEKIRFKDDFHFTINVNKDVNLKMTVPKMIIQNYVENAVKHGLKNNSGNKELKVNVIKLDNQIDIIIQDNGIGRIKASQNKQFSTGKGLAIMSSIYNLYYKIYKISIRQEIEDLYDKNGNPAGTRVIISVPIEK